MVANLVKALNSTVAKYPNFVPLVQGYVTNSLNWLKTQNVVDTKSLFRGISFTVDFGSVPEFNGFKVTKASGSLEVFGSTNRSSQFPVTVESLVAAAKRNVNRLAESKRTDAAEKAAAAKAKAEEAQRLAAEAARLAEIAEAEAEQYGNAARYL